MNEIYKIKLFRKNIELTNYAIVSLHHIDNVDKYKWYLGKDEYPFTYINGSRVPLHRFIWYINTCIKASLFSSKDKFVPTMQTEQIIDNKIVKYYVDHINRNKLDATDNNLRLATPAQNSYNKTPKNKISPENLTNSESQSQLHHIKLKKTGYEITITKNKITNKINKIATLEEAKKIYNMMAQEMFDEFAVLY